MSNLLLDDFALYPNIVLHSIDLQKITEKCLLPKGWSILGGSPVHEALIGSAYVFDKRHSTLIK